MMQKRSIYSLLLTSFILVFVFTMSFADEVRIEDKTVLKCQSGVLNITVDNDNPIGAFEIIFEVSEGTGTPAGYFTAMTVDWDTDFDDHLLHRYIDYPVAISAPSATVRMAALRLDVNDTPLPAGETVVGQLDFTANNTCAGTVEANGISIMVGQDVCANTECEVMAMTQFVDVTGLTRTPVPFNIAKGGTIVTITNAVPTIDPISNATVHWGTNYDGQAFGHDLDLASGCEALTYSVVTVPATSLGINPTTGEIHWATTAADMIAAYQYLVTVTVTDQCNATASTDFTIDLWNDAPEFNPVPNDTLIGWGALATGTLYATDDVTPPDPGPGNNLVYYLISFSGPGTFYVGEVSGNWTWQSEFLPEYTGTFVCSVLVHDSAAVPNPVFPKGFNPSHADTAVFNITVVPFLITIEKTHDSYQGREDSVEITMLNSDYENYPMGGFDFLVQYDASALFLNTVDEGQFIRDCGWEYFTYRHGPSGNCGANACPSGVVRIVAIAETNNGMNHPICYTNHNGPPIGPASNQLAVMRFLVTNDRTFECQYVPIRWIWYDCGDNAISDTTGNILFISRYVWEFEADVGDPAQSIHWGHENDGFPTLFGAPDVCMVDSGDGKPDILRLVDFVNGGIDIVCADSIDLRGDINLNGLANEIADAVLFTNYFVHGLSVFDVNTEGQIAASDVNADGITLSVADLVYLIRLVVGDVVPYAKVVTPVDVRYIHTEDGVMSVKGVEMGAAFLVVEGNMTPELKAINMDMLYRFDGVNTRILVYSLEGNSFSGEFINITGNVISIEMATRDGNPVNAKLTPTRFALQQNYPNPFNPITTISFSLPLAGDFDLTIYNVTGQTVAHFTGTREAGDHTIDWDASNQASGIYFYKLTSDNHTDTKKMVLLK